MEAERRELEPERLGRWLRAVATTQDDEVDCDALFEVVEEVVEAAASGQDVKAILPAIALHLEHCLDCQDHFETLVALTREAE